MKPASKAVEVLRADGLDPDPAREFEQAMHEYRNATGRMFPTWSEVLEVLKSLGYQKLSPASGAPKLLIVEDHRATRSALRDLFKIKGYEVWTASTVAEAVALLEIPPQCLILDLMLPDGEGETVLRKVRANDLTTRVVVCTGSGDQRRLEAIKALSPHLLLRKPVALADLCLACESVLAG
jgi:CheY-like chemotaxis protein